MHPLCTFSKLRKTMLVKSQNNKQYTEMNSKYNYILCLLTSTRNASVYNPEIEVSEFKTSFSPRRKVMILSDIFSIVFFNLRLISSIRSSTVDIPSSSNHVRLKVMVCSL